LVWVLHDQLKESNHVRHRDQELIQKHEAYELSKPDGKVYESADNLIELFGSIILSDLTCQQETRIGENQEKRSEDHR